MTESVFVPSAAVPTVSSQTQFAQRHPSDRHRHQTDPVLQLDKINVSFDGFRALTDLSLQIGVGNCAASSGLTARGKLR